MKDHARSVSVVIPTHNRRGLLGMTLASVRAQREVQFEVVIVDDGSTDRTPRFLGEIQDQRVRVLRNERPRGVSAARNRGIAAACGDWIAFCDDDDLWAPDKLSSQLAAARDQARLWVYTGSVNINIRNEVVAGRPPPSPDEVINLIGENNVIPGGCSSVAVHRALVERTGGFDEGLSAMADWDLWLRLSRNGLPAAVLRPLVGYRVHDANLSLDRERMEREFKEMKRRHPSADPGNFYRYLGWWCMRAGRRREAISLLLKAGRARSSNYPWREVISDLTQVALTVAETKGIRLRHRTRKAARPTHDDWLAEGARWIGEVRPNEGPGELDQ